MSETTQGPVGVGRQKFWKEIRRQKFWKEISPKEKMERMRSEVKTTRQQLSSAWDLIHRLKHHSHTQDGSIVIPFNEGGTRFSGLGSLRSSNPDEVFF